LYFQRAGSVVTIWSEGGQEAASVITNKSKYDTVPRLPSRVCSSQFEALQQHKDPFEVDVSDVKKNIRGKEEIYADFSEPPFQDSDRPKISKSGVSKREKLFECASMFFSTKVVNQNTQDDAPIDADYQDVKGGVPESPLCECVVQEEQVKLPPASSTSDPSSQTASPVSNCPNSTPRDGGGDGSTPTPTPTLTPEKVFLPIGSKDPKLNLTNSDDFHAGDRKNHHTVNVNELEIQFLEVDQSEYKSRVLYALVFTIIIYVGGSHMYYNKVVNLVKAQNNYGDPTRELLGYNFELYTITRGYAFARINLNFRLTSSSLMLVLMLWTAVVKLSPNRHHDSIMLFFNITCITILTRFLYDVMLMGVYSQVLGCVKISEQQPFSRLHTFPDLSRENNSHIEALNACILTSNRSIYVCIIIAEVYLLEFTRMTIRKHWHLQISYLYIYILLIFVLQYYLLIFPQTPYKILDLFFHNFFTGTFIYVGVMYREFVSYQQARKKFINEAKSIYTLDKNRNTQMRVYSKLQHEVQNDVIAIEGTVAEMLSTLFNKVERPGSANDSTESINVDPSMEEEAVSEMKNLLANVIMVKRSIHHHDMIRQIDDKSYITRKTWEGLDDIIAMLTEGERNVNVVFGDGIVSEGGGKLPPYEFYLDGDALSFLMADAVRNAKKYSPGGEQVMMVFDFNGKELIVDCQNKVGSKHKALTAENIENIFAREADLANRGFVSSNLGLPAAYHTAKFLPEMELNFYDNHEHQNYGEGNFEVVVHFEVTCTCEMRLGSINKEGSFPVGLVGVAIDDSLVARRTSSLLMTRYLNIEEYYILGVNQKEVLDVVPKIMGRVEGYKKADIILLDQVRPDEEPRQRA